MISFKSHFPLVLVLTSLLFSVNTLAANTLIVSGNAVPPNSRQNINISVEGSETSPETHVPVTVINGAKPGPVLAAVAGVHGYEYNSILALEQWLRTIDPSELSGAIIAVRVAHVPSFEARSVYVNPYDRKNLNRSFPGSPTGTQTERIAWAISRDVVANADFLIDLHSGDGAEWLAPFVGVYGGPLSTDYPLAMQVAKHFGFPNIVTYDMLTQKQVDTRRSLNRQGVAQKIPTVLVEIGQNGSKTTSDISAMISGLNRALYVIGLTKHSTLETNSTTPHFFKGTQSVPVNHTGLWFPSQETGRFVSKGEVLGIVKDYFGNVVEEVRAPIDGYALYGLMGPSVRNGESVMTIAKPTTDELH